MRNGIASYELVLKASNILRDTSSYIVLPGKFNIGRGHGLPHQQKKVWSNVSGWIRSGMVGCSEYRNIEQQRLCHWNKSSAASTQAGFFEKTSYIKDLYLFFLKKMYI